MKNFKHIVSTNMISKFPISVADIINHKNIYGPLMENIKGKSTRIKPRLEIKYDIKVPINIYKNNYNIDFKLKSYIYMAFIFWYILTDK